MIIVLIIWQANDLNKWFYVDNMRYQEELNVINNIGHYLESDFNTHKPVLFFGERELSENIKQYTNVSENAIQYKIANNFFSNFGITLKGHRIKYVTTNGNSYINWGITAVLGEPSSQLTKFFNINGYGIKSGSREMYDEARVFIDKMPGYPQEGYIVELDDYIIVKFQ